MNKLASLDMPEIGRRLSISRETAGVSLERAASALSVSKSTLSSIEKGHHSVQIEDIQVLARLFGTSLNAILRQEAVYVNLIPRFKKFKKTEKSHIMEAAQLLNMLVKAEAELESSGIYIQYKDTS